jgi:hypothetical protein
MNALDVTALIFGTLIFIAGTCVGWLIAKARGTRS